MGVSATVAAVEHQVTADLLTGTAAKQTIEQVAATLQVGVKQEALPIVENLTGGASSKAVAAAETTVEKAGVIAKSEATKTVESFPTMEAEFNQVRASLGKSTSLPSAAAAGKMLATMAQESVSKVVSAALEDVEMRLPGLKSKIMDLWSRVGPMADAEELVAAIASRGVKDKLLTAEEVDGFVRTVHGRLCRALRDDLKELLTSPEIVADMEAALAELSAQSKAAPELLPQFRERVRAIVAEHDDAVVAQLVDRVADPVVRAASLERLFDLIFDRYATAVVAAKFGPDGKRRLLTALASFRKEYTAVGRAKAMESLIGWMYEATRDASEAVHGDAERFRSQLSRMLSDKYRELGLLAGEEVSLHFEVAAPNLKKGAMRQATDLFATVPLSLGQGRTVHILATALESKGEHGVLQGIQQVVEDLPRRYRPGASVRTELMHFTVGKDLFLTVEDAIRALKSDIHPDFARSLAAEARGGPDRYRALVMSPLPKAIAEQTYPASFGPGGRVTYLQNSTSRSTMLQAAQGIASIFGL